MKLQRQSALQFHAVAQLYHALNLFMAAFAIVSDSSVRT